jgi:drug/metabolite transporter (DMT)-like permease
VIAVATWGGVAAIVISATAGDVLQASAMRQIGDLGVIRQSHGLGEVIRRVVSNPRFMIGMVFMAMGFFSLLITLSWADVSVVGPASASLTFVANAFAARIFLNEHVSRRRWAAALFVAGGVALLAS